MVGIGAAAVIGLGCVGVGIVYMRKRRTVAKGDGAEGGEPIQIAETMEVVYNYVPNLSDEIYLCKYCRLITLPGDLEVLTYPS